jgi:hypothetical protein
LEERTATLYGAAAVRPAIAATVAGEVMRLALSTVPVGLGCGNRITLSPASAQVRWRGPFKPLAMTTFVLAEGSTRVMVPASLLA